MKPRLISPSGVARAVWDVDSSKVNCEQAIIPVVYYRDFWLFSHSCLVMSVQSVDLESIKSDHVIDFLGGDSFPELIWLIGRSKQRTKSKDSWQKSAERHEWNVLNLRAFLSFSLSEKWWLSCRNEWGWDEVRDVLIVWVNFDGEWYSLISW